MEKKYQDVNNLQVSEVLLSFVNTEILQDTDISPEKFWKGFDAAVHELTPKNKNLIEKREVLQKKLITGILVIKAMKLKLMNIKNF